ncbi:hypothetical protein BG006_005989 [Podila minutissima]|uniref:AIG1-type G domain-containing protein n=1 Tax=Podila minutissima TaxID=64525 RepID=A0A9P5VLQ7_9FUNG|nr:hypothetical protein BG006_005989 [Podila minutissima]
MSSPSAPRQKMIVVGKTGSGKSTLCNMLVQGDLYTNNVRKVSDSAAGVSYDVEVVKGRHWTACDTVGLGELYSQGPGMVGPAMQLLVRVLKEGEHGFHYIAFVVQKGRLSTQENAELFKLFKATFDGAERNFVLVITHCHSESWITKNRHTIKEVYGDIPVVHCDFPFNSDTVSQGQHGRTNSLNDLERQLKAIPRWPVVPTLSMAMPPNPTPEQTQAREEATKKFSISLGTFLQVGWSIIHAVLFFLPLI